MRLQIKIAVIVSIFLLVGCKKKTVVVEEKVDVVVPVEYSTLMEAAHRYTKNASGGYDTLLSLISFSTKHYPVSHISYSLNTLVTCNGYPMKTNFSLPNKWAFVKPSSNWNLTCNDLSLVYSNSSNLAFPSVSNVNWFSIDSIEYGKSSEVDFTSFNDYDYIAIGDPSSYDYFTFNYPQTKIPLIRQYFRLTKQPIPGYSTYGYINITAVKTNKVVDGNHVYYISNKIYFTLMVKFYVL
jgi:hypothetical protein